ncbi:MAG: transposase [Candidatus Omnitrophota bacterium]
MCKYHNKYRVESTRLRDWDYSSSGYYFITICMQNRVNCFGAIIGGCVKLSEIGGMADKLWNEIPRYFQFAKIDNYIVMPNHIHGILAINRRDAINRDAIGRDAIGRDAIGRDAIGRDAINRVSTLKCGGITGRHNPMNANSLSRIIRWYKGRTTFEIHKLQTGRFFRWQERFYEHVIRDEKSLHAIRQYIVDNPIKWESDPENPSIVRN